MEAQGGRERRGAGFGVGSNRGKGGASSVP